MLCKWWAYVKVIQDMCNNSLSIYTRKENFPLQFEKMFFGEDILHNLVFVYYHTDLLLINLI